jgi:hypothetical protein
VEVNMRLASLALAIGLLPSLTGCARVTEPPAAPRPVVYQAYTGYYYHGPSGATDTTFFFHTKGAAAFNQLFLFVYEHNPNPAIPPADLATKDAVSVVKYGQHIYEFRINSVLARDRTLEVDYAAVDRGSATWIAACPLIIMTNLVDEKIRLIRYIENGHVVKEIFLESPGD